jgi:hypothetical protein
MIIWLASYPKSGNTMLRTMLSAYLFSKDGIFNFDLLKNIKQYPNHDIIKKLNIDPKNRNEIVKNSIKGQEFFNKNSGIGFLKTHNSLYNFKSKYPFTDYNNTLGAIYIVRDPRNVVISYSRHLDLPVEEIARVLIKAKSNDLDIMGSWRENYLSWKPMIADKKCLLIKYEDLISNRKKTFLEILKFVYGLRKIALNINKDKLENMLSSTSFEYLKNLEKKNTFRESLKSKDGKKITFFDKGPARNWNEELKTDLKNQIEEAFKYEMVELGYL